ncbi:hypothetical protein GALL_313640 [mine drainage metagenome]|uniref:Tetratricopeptide repeat protein n=1 Tax=mine drainage metagenome TaxID=410659 RepID=A0A1J5R400_9ZZZZ
MSRSRRVLALLALLALAFAAYWPGRHGAFLFDDYSNLATLGAYGPIDRAWKVVAFLTSGFAGPTGRPLALATFLLDARNWPAAPEAFKLTNIALHLLNGALLAGLLAALGRALGVERGRAATAAVLAAGLWLLDPFWVSTTLYVVQRMAMLATTFVIAGLWAYAHGRGLLQRGRRRAGYGWMSVALTLGTMLATLSKENGALLPLLAWVLEATVFDRRGDARDTLGVGFLRWRRVFIVLPALVLLGYLLRSLPAVWEGLKQGRDFTPGQRLLTEGRVLWTYLRDIWLPRAHDGGLFHDDFSLSHGLLEPVSTLFAWFGIIVLVAWAVVARRARTDWVVASAAAIAFFLAGHLIESTWLQLELVFEHRNYLPAILMFWPLSLALLRGARDRAGKLRWPVWFALALLALFAAQTTRRAETWGEPFQQALQWAHEHPRSPRAQAYLANFWSRTGNQTEAARLLDAALRDHPKDLLLLINRSDVACAVGAVPRGLRSALLEAVATANLGAPVTQFQFERLLDAAGSCGVFGAHFESDLLDSAGRNPAAAIPVVGRDLLHREALVALRRGDALRAYAFDLRSLHLSTPPPGARLRFAAELASAGQPKLALQLLDAVPSPLEAIHGWSMGAWHQRWLRHVGFYQESEHHLRAVLQREISSAAQSGAVKSIGDEHGTLAAASTAR